MQICPDNMNVQRRRLHIMCFEMYRQLLRTTVSSISPSFFLCLFLPGPPVVVMGRDLSAHLMQLMFACAWGHKHRDTHSPDTHSAPLSPSVTTLSHSLSSASFPRSPTLFLPCIPHSFPASSPTLYCAQSLNIFQLCYSSQCEAL